MEPQNIINLAQNLLAYPIEGGYSWTLVSRLGEILNMIEGLYGERDKSFTLLGIEFATIDQPQIWFPGHEKKVIIQLTTSCITDLNMALFQLSHEAIHCLNPVRKGESNVLEEGIATSFSIKYCRALGIKGFDATGSLNYDRAMIAYNIIESIDKDIIKRIRVKKPSISSITAQDLITENDKIPTDVAEFLGSKFL